MSLAAALGCGTSNSNVVDGGGSGGSTGTHMFVDGFTGSGMGSAMGSPATVGPGALGPWAYAAGMTTRACPGETPTDAAPEGNLVIAKGATADEVVVTEPGACDLRFKIAGHVATIVDGQTCAGSDGANGTITFSKMSWTLTLSADEKTLTEALSADETLAPASGTARTCQYTERNVTLARPK
ncbi:MAG TPA: hypothetical protein VHJ20_10575 [Polyangia bacterium]|nr:hypothetical protein [Polyangia bacterium]